MCNIEQVNVDLQKALESLADVMAPVDAPQAILEAVEKQRRAAREVKWPACSPTPVLSRNVLNVQHIGQRGSEAGRPVQAGRCS